MKRFLFFFIFIFWFFLFEYIQSYCVYIDRKKLSPTSPRPTLGRPKTCVSSYTSRTWWHLNMVHARMASPPPPPPPTLHPETEQNLKKNIKASAAFERWFGQPPFPTPLRAEKTCGLAYFLSLVTTNNIIIYGGSLFVFGRQPTDVWICKYMYLYAKKERKSVPRVCAFCVCRQCMYYLHNN